jgi:transcriptional regulator with XRE-family HTH domain
VKPILFADDMPARDIAKSVALQFGRELRAARIGRELTQQALAEKAGIDPVFVSFLENGHRQPSLTVLLALEKALDVAAGELVRRVAQGLSADLPARELPTRGRRVSIRST